MAKFSEMSYQRKVVRLNVEGPKIYINAITRIYNRSLIHIVYGEPSIRVAEKYQVFLRGAHDLPKLFSCEEW
jgi:hypothetical protein